MQGPGLPTVDLVVATLGRSHELDVLLTSLEGQAHGGFRVVIVDQNDDDRVAQVVARHPALSIEAVRSAPGLSRARNAALPLLTADLVGFPDDDCTYPPDLIGAVARRFAAQPDLDGLTGRTASASGEVAPNWSDTPGPVDRKTIWHRANSASLFLRGQLVERVGAFDERLGIGSGNPWSSAEELDYLLRALALGARVHYDPDLVVVHELRSPAADGLRALGRRDGASVGFLLRKHRYPATAVARMLVRPLGGAAVSLLGRDTARAGYYAATLRGRVAGYRAASRSSAKSAA
ncbi:MAG TPA: glycosyltransferase family A protein [Gaiella sp.]